MTPENKALVEQVDTALADAGLPTYAAITALLVEGMSLIEHRGRARNDWVAEVVRVVDAIHAKPAVPK